MNEWMENGCRLAWLINPIEETAYIYKPGMEPLMQKGFKKKLSGENVLPGFELDLKELMI